MAQQLNQLRVSTMKTTGEAIPRQSARAFLASGSHRQAGPPQPVSDFRAGENFNHLKLTAEKMMQEQATAKSDLQILKSKLQKAEEQVRTLEAKLLDMNNDNATLKVKHSQDMKLWKGLDSKFLSTTAFCDQLAETLQLLDNQIQEGERSKTYLEDKLAERLEFFEYTECRLKDLSDKKENAEDSLKQCEASNIKLQSTIREMEQTFQSDSIKFQKQFADEKDDLLEQLTKARKANEDSEAIIRSTRCEIQELQTELISKAKETTHLQHLNLTLMQGKGELELEVKGLQSLAATRLNEREAIQHELELFKLKVTDLEKVNASAAVNNENLLAEISKLTKTSEEDKISQEKLVSELRQHLVETETHVEGIEQQLLEAIKENERMVKVVGEHASRSASLQDEINRLCQECTEKSQLILCMSQNEECLRRENTMERQLELFPSQFSDIFFWLASHLCLPDLIWCILFQIQGQLAAAEGLVKCLEEKFNLQLKAQQEESRKNLQDISQRNSKELAETRRKYEAEIKEAIANEMLKCIVKLAETKTRFSYKHSQGEEALKTVKEESNQSMAIALEAYDQRWQSFQEDCERRVCNLREAHHEETTKIVAIHADELYRKDEEVHRLNETISKLREGHEGEKLKIASNLADEIRRKEEELYTVKEKIFKLREGYEQDLTKIRSIHVDEIQNKEEALRQVKERISELEAGHEKEKTKIVAIHADEIHKLEVELYRVKERISELEEGHEQEKTKIVAFHAEEIRKVQDGLQTEQTTNNDNIAQLNELHRKFEMVRHSNEKEMEKFHQDYRHQLQKVTEENSQLLEATKELQLAHEERLIRTTQEHQAELARLEKYQQAEVKKAQSLLTIDIDKWRSKALGWETQLKKALQENNTKEVSKEDEYILNEDFMMRVTGELVSKDIPAAIVTPITKDKEPQKQNKRLGVRAVHLEDTTAEDAEEESQKSAPQGRCRRQRGPRTGKRKVDDANPLEEAPRVNGKMTRRRKEKKTTEHYQASADSTKATEVDHGSFGNKQTSKTKNNVSQQPKLILRQHSVDESRRNTGLRCTQESELNSMPGPTQQKGTRYDVLGFASEGKKTAPKRTGRTFSKDVSPEKNQSTKALSPAISDLFQMARLPSYYKGDDPYAFEE